MGAGVYLGVVMVSLVRGGIWGGIYTPALACLVVREVGGTSRGCPTVGEGPRIGIGGL